jgi:GT2 family glycosyltransferase
MEENSEVGAATCKVILSNGKVDLTAHRGFPTPWASFRYYFLKDDSLYHQSKKNMDKPHEVDAISGSFFLTRKSVLNDVGYFDEDYFMYAEDIDLCFRIKSAGYKVMYVPKVSIIHHKGISSGLKKHSQHISTADLETKKRAMNAFYKTMKIFYKKHLERKYPFFINWLIYLGINLKWALAKRKMHV